MKNRISTAILVSLLAIGLALLSGHAGAVPTTSAATSLTASGCTFNGESGNGDTWFVWGGASGAEIWSTPNQSATGSFTDTQYGTPMLSGRTYYYKACDTSGCGNEVSFAIPAAMPVNQTYYGSGLITIMRSGMNITQMLPIMSEPYTNQFPTGWAGLIWALLFGFIITGLWMRQGDVTIPMFVCMVFSAIIFGANSYGGLGLPPQVQDIAVGLFAASLAGLFMSWFSK